MRITNFQLYQKRVATNYLYLWQYSHLRVINASLKVAIFSYQANMRM